MNIWCNQGKQQKEHASVAQTSPKWEAILELSPNKKILKTKLERLS